MEENNRNLLLTRVLDMRRETSQLRQIVDGEQLLASDHQYLSRCFDLLDMELGALQQYIREIQ